MGFEWDIFCPIYHVLSLEHLSRVPKCSPLFWHEDSNHLKVTYLGAKIQIFSIEIWRENSKRLGLSKGGILR